MNNQEVINEFVARRPAGSHTLESRNGKLFSYNTCIAQVSESNYNVVLLNKTYYSPTTSRHRNMAYKSLIDAGYEVSELENIYIPRGAQSLLEYER